MTRVLLDNWGRDVFIIFILWKVPSNFHGEAGTTRMSSTVCDDIDELVACCRGVFIHALGWIIPAWLISATLMFQSTRHEPGCARATNHMASRNFTCPGYRQQKDREVSTGSKRSMRNPSYQQLRSTVPMVHCPRKDERIFPALVTKIRNSSQQQGSTPRLAWLQNWWLCTKHDLCNP